MMVSFGYLSSKLILLIASASYRASCEGFTRPISETTKETASGALLGVMMFNLKFRVSVFNGISDSMVFDAFDSLDMAMLVAGTASNECEYLIFWVLNQDNPFRFFVNVIDIDSDCIVAKFETFSELVGLIDIAENISVPIYELAFV